VPLKEAFISGGSEWDLSKKKSYSNFLIFPHHLVAVSKSANRSKQDKDIAHWLPSYPGTRCAYVKWWVEIKKQWDLTMDSTETAFVTDYLNTCK